MLSKDQTPEGWHAKAEGYDREVVRLTSQFARDAIRLLDVKPGDRVLDVAAGTGAAAIPLAEKGARVTAIDWAPAMVERLKTRAAAAKLPIVAEVGDGQALRYADASFDAAICNFGVMFFPDPDRGLAELARVLRPGGRAAVTTWTTDIEFFHFISAAVRRVLPDAPPPPAPPAILRLSDGADLEARMRRAGFREVRLSKATHPWEFPSAREFWSRFPESSAAVEETRARLGPKWEAVGSAVIEVLEARHGKGPVGLAGTAHVAIAVR